jgi:hypothetical protein
LSSAAKNEGEDFTFQSGVRLAWRALQSAVASDLVNFVNLVNLVRNLLFFKSNLMGKKGSHKVHEVHKPDRSDSDEKVMPIYPAT